MQYNGYWYKFHVLILRKAVFLDWMTIIFIIYQRKKLGHRKNLIECSKNQPILD